MKTSPVNNVRINANHTHIYTLAEARRTLGPSLLSHPSARPNRRNETGMKLDLE